MNPELVSFKGTREGLSITLGEGPWRDVLNELAAQLDRPGAQSFFQGARVLLETGPRAVDVLELEELIALLSQHGMTLTSVIGGRNTQDAFEQVRRASPPPPEAFSADDETAVSEAAIPSDTAPAMLIRRTVRSGQRYRYAGTIVIIGDVNPGAEVIAEGDVIVWGKLRGVVHAGAAGNDNAIVSALILAPTQLRISGYIARAPDDKRRQRNVSAEIARVRDGQIVVEPWSGM
jgi:septum site-determining protein MinC